MEIISQIWPWYLSGPLLAAIMFLLLWAGGEFGVSGNLRSLCTMCGAGKHASFFRFDWKKQGWNLVFVLGAVIGGYIAVTFLPNPNGVEVSAATVADLQALGIAYDKQLVPQELFNWQSLFTFKGFTLLVIGGFLVGFGTRWAGGCTSGHAISGLSNLQLPSLIAVIGFFLGGLIMTHLLFPFIF